MSVNQIETRPLHLPQGPYRERIMALAAGRDTLLDRQLMSVFGVGDLPSAAAALGAFLHRVGVSTDPTQYGIPEPEWDRRIDAALLGPRGRNFIAAA